MAAKVGQKRNRELDRDSRVTKKAKLISLSLNSFPDELLMQILAKIPKKYLGAISEVCAKWLQMTCTRYFWKLSCQQRWPNMLASDSTSFEIENYIIPTSIVQGETMIDWKFYWYLRKKFTLVNKLTSHLPPNTSNELQRSEMYHFLQVFSKVPVNSLSGALMEAAFDFACDLALVLFNRKDTIGFELALSVMKNVSIHSIPASHLGFCKRVLKLCQLVGDYNPKWTLKLFTIANSLLRAVSEFNDRFKEVLSSMTQFLINMSTLDLAQNDNQSHDLEFRYPIYGWGLSNSLSFSKQLYNHKELTEIIIDIASNMYFTSDDSRIRSGALCVGWLPGYEHKEYILKYHRMTMHAVRQSDPAISSAAMLGPIKIAYLEPELLKGIFSDKQLKKIFLVVSDALDRLHVKIKMTIYYVLLRVLTTFNRDLITDAELDELILRVLRMFTEIEQWRNHEMKSIYRIDKLGSLFGERLAGKMDAIKAVLFLLAQCKKIASPEHMIEGYIKLGVKVKGSKFNEEFKELTQKITNVDLPFQVSIIKCYKQFGFQWAKNADPEERQQIIETLLRAIPDCMYQLGQQRVESYTDPTGGPKDYPITWTELQQDRNDLQKIDCVGRLNKAPFHMSRKDIKPINDQDEGFKPQFSMFMYDVQIFTAQLLKIIQYRKFKGMYVHHAQDVLHAALACFRSTNSNHEYLTIIDLLSCVKEEMEPSELFKYVDIIIECLLEKQQRVGGEKAQNQFLLLFRYCLSILKDIPEYANVVILTKAINICIGTEKFVIPLFADLSDFIYYFITCWPRYTHLAIKVSKLGQWLMVRLTQDLKSKEDSTDILMVFAIVAGLYGIEYVLEALCVDPDAHKYNSHESYLDLVVPHCQVLYKAVRRGNVKISPLHHNYLRKFLILIAIYRVDSYAGTIAAIPKQGSENIERLQSAIASDKFDTGVPKLNKLVKSLDLAGICRELCLQRAKYEDHINYGDIDSDEDMFFVRRRINPGLMAE